MGGRILGWVALLALAVIAVGFAMLNSEPVQIIYKYGSLEQYGALEMPLAWIVGLAIAFGLLVGFIVNLFVVIKLKREIAALRRNEARASAGASPLRAIPLNSR